MDVDVQRIVADRAYARGVRERIEQLDDEDTLVLALSIGNDLGLLATAAPEPLVDAATEPAVVPPAAAQRKYIGGVRG